MLQSLAYGAFRGPPQVNDYLLYKDNLLGSW